MRERCTDDAAPDAAHPGGAAVAGDGRWERPIHYEDGWVTAGMNAALDTWMAQVRGRLASHPRRLNPASKTCRTFGPPLDTITSSL